MLFSILLQNLANRRDYEGEHVSQCAEAQQEILEHIFSADIPPAVAAYKNSLYRRDIIGYSPVGVCYMCFNKYSLPKDQRAKQP